MVQTHVCWTDWFEYYILCPNCASNFGEQWTGSTGDDLPTSAKNEIWDDTHEDAKTFTHCERCKCELSGDVYEKNFNPEPYPDTDSDLYDPEELTVPPMDFSELSDQAIAQWLWNGDAMEILVDPVVMYQLWRSIQALREEFQFDKPELRFEQAIANLTYLREPLMQMVAIKNPSLYHFVYNEGDRHLPVNHYLKKIASDEPTQAN